MKKILSTLLFVFTIINVFAQTPAIEILDQTNDLFSNKVINPIVKVPLDEESILIYDYDGSLFSFNLDAEQINWTVKATDSYTEMCANSLVLKDGVIYIPFINGEVFAIDNQTGSVFWKSRLGTATDHITLKNQVPIIKDGKLYLTNQNNTIYALTIKDGSLVWSYKLEETGPHFPVLLFDKKVFTQNGSTFYSFDASTGKVVSERNFEQAISAKPITDGKNVFIANKKDLLFALNPANLDSLWQFKLDENQYNINENIFCKNKKIYFAAEGLESSSLYCVDSQTGKQLWKTDFEGETIKYIIEQEGDIWGYTTKGKLFKTNWNGEVVLKKRLTTLPISNLEFAADGSLFYYCDAGLIQFELNTQDENVMYMRTSIKEDVYSACIKIIR